MGLRWKVELFERRREGGRSAKEKTLVDVRNESVPVSDCSVLGHDGRLRN